MTNQPNPRERVSGNQSQSQAQTSDREQTGESATQRAATDWTPRRPERSELPDELDPFDIDRHRQSRHQTDRPDAVYDPSDWSRFNQNP